jgi:hypothetical protein
VTPGGPGPHRRWRCVPRSCRRVLMAPRTRRWPSSCGARRTPCRSGAEGSSSTVLTSCSTRRVQAGHARSASTTSRTSSWRRWSRRRRTPRTGAGRRWRSGPGCRRPRLGRSGRTSGSDRTGSTTSSYPPTVVHRQALRRGRVVLESAGGSRGAVRGREVPGAGVAAAPSRVPDDARHVRASHP